MRIFDPETTLDPGVASNRQLVRPCSRGRRGAAAAVLDSTRCREGVEASRGRSCHRRQHWLLDHQQGVALGATLRTVNGQPSLFGDPPEPPPKVVAVRPYKRRAPHKDLLPGEAAHRMATTKAATEAAIDQVDAHADEEWKGVALACVRTCALTHPSFTADEVWMQLEGFPELGTHEPAALGPVFLRAAKLGWIVNSGQRRKRSLYAQRHRELTVWHSTVYAPSATSEENGATI